MCWELAAAAALSAAGSLVQHQAQQRALANQMRLAMQQQALQKRYADEATQAALAEAEQYQQEPRAAAEQAIQQELEAKLTAPYTTGAYAGPQAPRYAGLQTDSYIRDKALATERVLSEAFNQAKLQAKLLAPSYLRMNEGVRLGDVSSEIGTLGNFSKGSAAAAEPLIKSAGVPNSGAMALGSLLQGLGSGMATQYIFAPGAKPPSPGTLGGYTPSPEYLGKVHPLQYPTGSAYSPSSLFSTYRPLR